jgi:hypothetical protein
MYMYCLEYLYCQIKESVKRSEKSNVERTDAKAATSLHDDEGHCRRPVFASAAAAAAAGGVGGKGRFCKIR